MCQMNTTLQTSAYLVSVSGRSVGLRPLRARGGYVAEETYVVSRRYVLALMAWISVPYRNLLVGG